MFLQAIPPESSVGNEKTPLLADWHGFGVFLAFFRLAPRRRCPSLTPGPNCTKLGFLGFCRPFHRNRVLEAETYQYYQITPILLPGATFGVFSADSKTTLSCAYLWTELHQTRLPVFLQAIPPESGVGNGKTPLLAHWHGFGVFLAFFWLAPRRRCPSLTPGPNCTKLGFLGFCRPFHRNRVLEAETYQYYQITPILLPGATFGVFSADSKTTLSCAYLWTELHQTRLPVFLQAIPPESGVGNGKTPLLADWHGFGVFLAFFRLAPRRRCPSLTPGPNCTKLGFLGFCRPVHRNRVLEAETYQYYQITPILLPGATFGVFSADSKTTLSCAYLWTELHQIRLPVFLQAIPPESSVGNEKTPLLADWHGFGVFFGVFLAGSKTTLPFAYPWTELHQTRFLGLLQAISPESGVGSGNIPVLPDYPNFAPWSNFWRFFGRLQDDAVLRLPLDRIAPNSVSCVFAGHST